ncbi:hypothetical protein DPMN_056336 [Dreissena polymorpha]|uniref:Uncharacterized protein n=1 Tax=Dreissena polymorpha TaxID=45954 RepID=A0A9D4CSC5_DREPO|nr:hypothetical protein DPMN_056336 [Dreissena polymorpha]
MQQQLQEQTTIMPYRSDVVPIGTYGRTRGVPTEEDGVSWIHRRKRRQHVHVILSNYLSLAVGKLGVIHESKVSSKISLCSLHMRNRDENFRINWIFAFLYENIQ